jgi:hypothetical protein
VTYQSQQRADFSAYGRKAAAAIMARVRPLPPEARGKALKSALAAIDPTLVARAEASAMEQVKNGMPPDQALEVGIALALSSGLITELAKVGKGAAVSSQPLLGLGALTSMYGTSSVTCKGYSWVAPTGTKAGRWDRTRVGQPDAPGPGTNASSCPTSVTGSGGGVTGGQSMQVANKYLKVGPLHFRMNQVAKINLGWGDKNPNGIMVPYKTPLTIGAMSPHWKQTLRDSLTSGVKPENGWTSASFAKWGMSALVPLFQAMGIDPDQTPINGAKLLTWDGDSDANGTRSTSVLQAREPIYKFKHPIDGSDWGVYLALGGGVVGPDPNAPKRKAYINAKHIELIAMPLIKPKERSWFAELVGVIVDAIDDFVTDVVDVVQDLTCSLISQPGAAGAAAAANPAAGAGVAIAGAHLCGGGSGPPDSGSSSGSSSGWMLPLAILAGGGALVFVLSKR